MPDMPPWRSKGKTPERIDKRPDHLPTGVIILINHKWYVEFTIEEKNKVLPVRDDDAWNCDIEAGSKVWLQEFPEDGGWRIVWREGMKRFVKVTLDHFQDD
jgi:hypothetical protein